jgi:acetyl-CoA carboxylase biotin carboxyl carrier protein
MRESLIEEVERLVSLVESHKISEITIRNDQTRVTVRKSPPGSSVRRSAESNAAHPSTGDDIVVTTGGSLSETEQANRYTITAPMVGIYHHAEPPVSIGSVIHKGQVVGVIETIKLMNDVLSDRDGVLEEIHVEAGMPVEYGQPLFVIIENPS